MQQDKDRLLILRLAEAEVAKAAKQNSQIAIRPLADRLVAEHPNSGMALAHLLDMIAALAAQQGVAINFDDRR